MCDNAMKTTSRQSHRDPGATETTPPGGSDKAFGLVFSAVFMVIALYPLIHGSRPRSWALGLAALFLLAALTKPGVLSPLNKVWTQFGMVLHRVVSPVALFIAFCLAVVPTGLVLRVLGKSPLKLRLEPAATTYWIKREPPGRSDQQMRKQF